MQTVPGFPRNFTFFMKLNFQPVYDFALDQVPIDDFIDIFAIDVGVPDLFRIDHDHGAKFTAVKAARGIDPDLPGARQAQLLDTLLGVIANLRRIALRAALLAAFAHVGAEKYVILVIRHVQLRRI